MYCQELGVVAYQMWWKPNSDSEDDPEGTFYKCHAVGQTHTSDLPFRATPLNGVSTWAESETMVRNAVASLQLHAPSVGVGAYVYPQWREWGVSWWVGAPMWLWVDAKDPLQWGTHTLTATEGGTAISATVTATKAQYDPGDGSSPVTCKGPGTPRPWNPRELMDKHSPSGCEHTYMHTNTLGDVNSRYTVTATVIWDVNWWDTNGQFGSFTVPATSTQSVGVHVGELRVVQMPPPR
jgi:hypothetical protein